ncbi:MAG: hypothetical protein HY360_03470 [Verrucomicrobia bacterium]|nr:hypothetical protein [Verrucomicrobiota bacterium]
MLNSKTSFATTVVGLRFSSHREITPYFSALKPAIPYWKENDGRNVSALRVLRGNQIEKNATGSLSARGRDK